MMRKRGIGIILAASYFDEQKVRSVAEKVDARAVIVPMFVGGAEGTEDYFRLVEYWIDCLLAAAEGGVGASRTVN